MVRGTSLALGVSVINPLLTICDVVAALIEPVTAISFDDVTALWEFVHVSPENSVMTWKVSQGAEGWPHHSGTSLPTEK